MELNPTIHQLMCSNEKGNTCARVSFLIKLQTWACDFTKKETCTGDFLWDLRIYCEYLSYRTSTDDCFYQMFSEEYRSVNFGKFLENIHTQLTFTSSKSTTETPEKGVKYVQSYLRCSDVFIVNFEHISHLF